MCNCSIFNIRKKTKYNLREKEEHGELKYEEYTRTVKY